MLLQSSQEKLLLQEKSFWIEEKDRLNESLEKSKRDIAVLKSDNLQHVVSRDIDVTADDVKVSAMEYKCIS